MGQDPTVTVHKEHRDRIAGHFTASGIVHDRVTGGSHETLKTV
jgi:hypothetical protein